MATLNKTLLRKLANASSYTRGQSYYSSNSILKLEKIGNEYIGKVRGTYQYTVSIEIDGVDNSYTCSCPYDFGGICKHIVAVGLAIIDNKYQTITGIRTYSPKEIYQQVFCQLPEADKVSFLTQLFVENHEARASILKIAQQKESWKKAESSLQSITITEVKHQLIAALLLFNLPVVEYDYDEEYYDDESDFQLECEEIIDDMTAIYEQDIKEKVKQKNILQALIITLGIYEAGCSEEYDYEREDDFGRSFELNTAMLNKAKDYLTYIGTAITQATHPLARQTKEEIVELWVEKCYVYQEANYVLIPAFYQFLTNLITDSYTAVYIENKIRQATLYGIKTVDILLLAAEKQNKPTLVKSLLKEFALERVDLSQRLLTLYWQEKAVSSFLQLGKLAFAKWPRDFADFLLDHITEKEDKYFFIKLLTYTTKRSSSIVGYQYLITFLTTQEKQSLITSLKEEIPLTFYVQILAVEKQFDEILAIVNQNFARNQLFPVLIRPILKERPKVCFELITRKVRERVHTERGRTVYRELVNYLQLAKKIPSFQKQLDAFIKWLTTNYKQLRALKDELQNAKLL